MSSPSFFFFFFNDTATTEIYTLSLHDALPIYSLPHLSDPLISNPTLGNFEPRVGFSWDPMGDGKTRSEEHTSELQSRLHLVCRLLLEKKKPAHAAHLVRFDRRVLSPRECRSHS